MKKGINQSNECTNNNITLNIKIVLKICHSKINVLKNKARRRRRPTTITPLYHKIIIKIMKTKKNRIRGVQSI